MKASTQLIDALNTLLTDELTAIDQYAPHEGRAQTWGYGIFAAYVAERTEDERKHAKALIQRIYELEGTPDTRTRNPVAYTTSLLDGLSHDRAAEVGAIAKYNSAIAIAVSLGDNATRDMLVANLKDEDDHLLDIEKRLVQAAQVTPAQWLSTQIG